MTRFPKLRLDQEDFMSLVWDLVNRVLNTTIGMMIEQYRELKLTQVNNVTFQNALQLIVNAHV